MPVYDRTIEPARRRAWYSCLSLWQGGDGRPVEMGEKDMPVYETEQKPEPAGRLTVPYEEVFYLGCGVEGCFEAECGCHRWAGMLVILCQDHCEERVGK